MFRFKFRLLMRKVCCQYLYHVIRITFQDLLLEFPTVLEEQHIEIVQRVLEEQHIEIVLRVLEEQHIEIILRVLEEQQIEIVHTF